LVGAIRGVDLGQILCQKGKVKSKSKKGKIGIGCNFYLFTFAFCLIYPFFAQIRNDFFLMQIRLFYSIFFFILFFSCQKPTTTSTNAPVPKAPTIVQNAQINFPKNIVLLIGDGMGLPQITAAMYMNGNKINLERMPISGVQKTHAKDDLITDSAASGTAMACGSKTVNGAIGVLPNGKPLTSILELAEKKGLATGLTVTSSITHATPASFIAHVNPRSDMELIALDFLKTEIDLMIGGGKRYFEKRKDGQNLLGELEKNNYNILDLTKNNFQNFVPDFTKPLAFFTDNDEPNWVTKGRDYLPEAAKISVSFLKKRSEKGFFLMIEGSQIDWAAHDNDLERTVAETLDFDKAVGNVLDWAENDGETLVIVTADHETGGLSINQQSKMGGPFKVSWSTIGHTGVMVPIFAKGPGQEMFGGVMDNTQIFEKMKFLLKL
jgi:alkaline phosphatase